jgi:hypothetical protein
VVQYLLNFEGANHTPLKSSNIRRFDDGHVLIPKEPSLALDPLCCNLQFLSWSRRHRLLLLVLVEQFLGKKKFPITSKCRYMYGVLNVDEIKN